MASYPELGEQLEGDLLDLGTGAGFTRLRPSPRVPQRLLPLAQRVAVLLSQVVQGFPAFPAGGAHGFPVLPGGVARRLLGLAHGFAAGLSRFADLAGEVPAAPGGLGIGFVT